MYTSTDECLYQLIFWFTTIAWLKIFTKNNMIPKNQVLDEKKSCDNEFSGGWGGRTVNGGWNGVTIQMKSVCTINFLLIVK